MWKWNFLYVIIPSKNTKISEFNQHWESNKAPSTIYADLKSLIKKLMDVKLI